MSRRNQAARVFVILGSVVLFASAALHSFAAFSMVFQALAASNLKPGLQAAFRVVFLSLGWHWVLTATVALLAGVTETRLRKMRSRRTGSQLTTAVDRAQTSDNPLAVASVS